MVAVLQFQENEACIGLSTRRAKPGPERDLVQRFTDYVIAAHQPKTSALGICKGTSNAQLWTTHNG